MKANHKRLKAALGLRVKKFEPAFLASKLGEFSLFDGFLDLADFLPFEFPNLDNFRLFNNFPNFLASSSLLSPTSNLMTSLSLFPTLGPDMSGDPVVFSNDISRATILLKP